jgi:hypothetical protein
VRFDNSLCLVTETSKLYAPAFVKITCLRMKYLFSLQRTVTAIDCAGYSMRVNRATVPSLCCLFNLDLASV